MNIKDEYIVCFSYTNTKYVFHIDCEPKVQLTETEKEKLQVIRSLPRDKKRAICRVMSMNRNFDVSV